MCVLHRWISGHRRYLSADRVHLFVWCERAIHFCPEPETAEDSDLPSQHDERPQPAQSTCWNPLANERERWIHRLLVRRYLRSTSAAYPHWEEPKDWQHERCSQSFADRLPWRPAALTPLPSHLQACTKIQHALHREMRDQLPQQ